MTHCKRILKLHSVCIRDGTWGPFFFLSFLFVLFLLHEYLLTVLISLFSQRRSLICDVKNTTTTTRTLMRIGQIPWLGFCTVQFKFCDFDSLLPIT